MSIINAWINRYIFAGRETTADNAPTNEVVVDATGAMKTSISGSTLTSAQRLPTYLTTGNGLEPTVGYATDGEGSTWNALYANVRQMGFNGATWDRLRVARRLSNGDANVVANGTLTVFVPGSGKRIRIMGVEVSVSVAGQYRVVDGTTEIGIFLLEANKQYFVNFPGNGHLSIAIDNAVGIKNTTVGAADIHAVLHGTQE